MIICYSIDKNGSIALQYSDSICGLIREFREEVQAHHTISVETKQEDYCADDAFRDLGSHLISLFHDADKEKINECFLHFPKGTSSSTVLDWFNKEFDFNLKSPLTEAAL